MPSKICSRCHRAIPLSGFSKDRQKTTGLRSACKQCCSADNRKWRERDPESNKRRLRKWNYGISTEEYELLINTQKNQCAICHNQERDGRSLGVDHCHKTGKIRGLLCFTCNAAIGLLKDNENILLSAIEYLKNAK